MNLREISRYSRQIIFGFLIVILVSIGGVVVFQYLTRPNPVFGNIDKPIIRNFVENFTPEWSTDLLSLNTSFNGPVYEVKSRGFTQSAANKLAKSLGFGAITQSVCSLKKCSSGNNLLTWQRLTTALTIDKDSGSVNYKDTSVLVSKSGTLFGYNRLRTTAETFLKNNGINLDQLISSDDQSVFYTLNGADFLAEVKDLGQAQLVGFNYYLSIDNWQVVNSDLTPYLTIQLTRDGRVYSLTYMNIQLEEDTNATYPLLSQGEAATALNKNKGYLARYLNSGYASAQLGNPSLINVGKGELKLFDDGVGDFIEPIYVFQAVAFKGPISAQAEVYLPAVKANYYAR